MSDKRPGQGFHYVQPKRKIPKLDISIVASGSSSSQQPMAQFAKPTGRAATNGHNRNQVAPSNRPAPVVQEAMSEDMWGDDDVELIMLASQVAENVENVGQNILVGSMDISFGGFMRNGNPNSCSTQKPLPEADDVLREFRTSDAAEDDVFTELIDYDQIDNIDKHLDEYLQNDQNTLAQGCGFATGTSARSLTSSKPTPSLVAKPSARVDAQADKKQLELKTKMLCDQLSQIQRENTRLQNEVFKMNEKCQTKDGEIAMIRYDLQQNKNIQSDLRKEKVEECERIKSEYTHKLNELDKRNQRQQSELEFKSLEIINLKSKQTHETSMNRSHTFRTPAPVDAKLKLPDATLASMFRLCLADPSNHGVLTRPAIFSQALPLNHKQSLINGHSDHLRSNVSQLQLLVAEQNAYQSAGQPPSAGLLERIFDTVSHSVWIIRDECRVHDTCRKSVAKNMFYQYGTPELNECRRRLLDAESVHMDGEMFAGEMLCAGRRVLGCMVSICAASRKFSEMVIRRLFREEGHTCLGLITEAFMAIGYSNQWQYYFGLLEAAAMLLEAISKHYTPEDRDFDKPLQLALQSLIFCRPNTKALVHIAGCLRTLSTHYARSEFLSTLCHQCTDYVLIKESMKSIQFSPKSCPLQMYSVLLQTEFAQFQTLRSTQLRILTHLTLDSLRLLDYCAQRPVCWMFRQSGRSEGSAKATSKKEPCLCYAQLVCACIVLMHLSLRHWTDDPKSIDIRIISTIAQTGVTMISDHFVMHYESIVLRVGGPWVKQRLHVAFSWISQHSKLFQLERSHLQAIQAISQLRRIPQMIELLGAGDGEASETATDSAAAKHMWANFFKSVAPTVTVSETIDYEFNDSDADNTQMVAE